MIPLFFAALTAAHAANADAALERCRPVLARKAGGEIATITVGSSRSSAKGLTIEGPLTAFLGMGPPAPGSASAHHLIRTNFTFRCTVGRRNVRSALVVPAR